jgi:dTMP kinase
MAKDSDQATNPGRFITFEGSEGVGKWTALDFACDYLRERGIPVLVTREPGGTPLAEDIRHMLLSKRNEQVDAKAELLLVFAARCQHVTNKIKPALAAGTWVLCDRFTDATFAYQGGGRGLSFERVAEIEKWALEGFKPDLTLLLDMPVEAGLQRALARSEADRFEAETLEFFEKVRNAYLQRMEADPERIKRVDAEPDVVTVQKQIVAVLDAFIHKGASDA